MNWSSRSSKTLRLFSIQLSFSAATWIWSQSSKKTVLLMRLDFSYVRSQGPPFYLTGLHNKSFIELGPGAVVHWCFPVNFAKFLRYLLLQNTSGGCFCRLMINLSLEYYGHEYLFQTIIIWYCRKAWCVTCVPWWRIICHDMILFCFPPQVMLKLYLNFLFNITATNQIKKYPLTQ